MSIDHGLIYLMNHRVIPLKVGERMFRWLELIKPYAVWAAGTDCDGMRLGSVGDHWTRRAAEADLESTLEWADGPMDGAVEFLPMPLYRARRRELFLDMLGWADSRDRYAEAAGY